LEEDPGLDETCWKTVQILLYQSEPVEESIHTDCKLFYSLHRDFFNNAPGDWSKATEQEAYDMCKSIVLKNTEFSKSLNADKQRWLLLNLAFTSHKLFEFMWSTWGILQATGET